MKNKRLLSMLLVISMLLPLASCEKDKVTDIQKDTSADMQQISENNPEETETVSAWDQLVPIDYEGYDFHILSYNSAGLTKWLDAEEENGEVLNDAIYYRNRAVEELYTVNIRMTAFDPDTTYSSMIAEVMASSGEYDIAVQWAMYLIGAASQGMLYNILDIPEMNTEAAWWNKDSVQNYQLVPGKLYYASNALYCNIIDAAFGLFFNKNLIESYSLENPYELVNNGTWTMDKMYSMMETVAGNTDGLDTRSAGDMYGIAAGWGSGAAFYHAYGLKYGEIDPKTNQMNVAFANERAILASDWINKILGDKNLTADPQYDTWAGESFTTGHTLFICSNIAHTASYRDVEDVSLGIVPVPKLDDSQERYYVNIGGRNNPLICLPADQTDASRTGNILEALTIYNHEKVTDVYIDVLLSSKYAQDVETRDMIKLLIDNLTYDVGFITIPTLFDTWVAAAKDGKIASAAKSIANAVQIEFEGYIEKIEALG